MSFHIVFWYWWALAAVLMICEMMLPGVVFMFLAIGAVAAGLLLLVASDLSLEMQLGAFAVIALASAVGLRPMLRGMQKRSDDPNLNARGEFVHFKTPIGATDTSVSDEEGTVGGSVPFGGRFEFRPELRFDNSNQQIFNGSGGTPPVAPDKKNQFTGTAAFLAWF